MQPDVRRDDQKERNRNWSRFPQELNEADWTTAQTLAVYSALAYYADFSDPEHGARPSLSLISEKSKVSLAQVKRELQRLHKHGAIAWIRGGRKRTANGGRTANQYHLCIANGLAGTVEAHTEPQAVEVEALTEPQGRRRSRRQALENSKMQVEEAKEDRVLEAHTEPQGRLTQSFKVGSGRASTESQGTQSQLTESHLKTSRPFVLKQADKCEHGLFWKLCKKCVEEEF